MRSNTLTRVSNNPGAVQLFNRRNSGGEIGVSSRLSTSPRVRALVKKKPVSSTSLRISLDLR